MKPTTVLTALATLLATTLCTLGSAEAGMIKIINNSNFVLGEIYSCEVYNDKGTLICKGALIEGRD